MSVLSSIGVFVVVLGFYVSVLMDDVPGGDAGELLAESCLLGVPHPPGYPLLTALSGLILRATNTLHTTKANGTDFAPIPAVVGNTLSASFTAAAAAVLYSTSRALILNDFALSTKLHRHQLQLGFLPGAISFLATAFFAFSPLVMMYAVSAEVFALNNFLCSLLIWAFVKVFTTKNSKGRLQYAFVGAFTSGKCWVFIFCF